MAGKKRDEGRRYADFAGVFGLPGVQLDYLTFVRLLLNEERIRLRNAADVFLGVAAAMGGGPLEAGWAEAFGSDPLEGGEVVDAANAARAAAEARRQLAESFGG